MKYLITCALPYANGELHLGHIFEGIQADIFAKNHRALGATVNMICGSDSHGTPIMLNAEKKGIKPEELVAKYQKKHKAQYDSFDIDFDYFGNTHSEDNKKLVEQFFLKLKDQGYIFSKEVEGFFDPSKEMFLPDRFIKGTCPKCKATEQYGDHCEVCNATYSPTELIDPFSVLSGKKPEIKTSEHYFLDLNKARDFIDSWLQTDAIPVATKNKLKEWLDGELKPWDLSRDEPYFGFKIPGNQHKYFYVWLDAPIAYIAIANKLGKDLWSDQIIHFIGKDISYFHCLFWPTILHINNYQLPSKIMIHGFVKLNGEKMSKSRGNYIDVEKYLSEFESDHLRYYFASKTAPNQNDLDLNISDLCQKSNADLVGKFVNLGSRAFKFINSKFDNKLYSFETTPEIFNEFSQKLEHYHALISELEYSKAVKLFMQLCEEANHIIDQYQPWKLIKDPSKVEQVHYCCSLAINLFNLLAQKIYIITPNIAKRAFEIINVSYGNTCLLSDHTVNQYKPILTRINPKELMNEKQVVTEVKEDGLITIDDLSKVKLQVGKILSANNVEGADKLLQLTVDLGDKKVNVFAGIKSSYTATELETKLVVVVANLKPRKMRFGLSEAMLLAAGNKDGVYLVSPDHGATPGDLVK